MQLRECKRYMHNQEEKLTKLGRTPNTVSVQIAVRNSLLIVLLGGALGLIAKLLDVIPFNELPQIFQYLDISNELSDFPFWLLIGLCVAVRSANPRRAALNVFLFFASMVAAYYAYTIWGAGFFPRRYMMVWVGCTVVSPLIGALCWYAKGESWVSVGISAVIIAVFALFTFGFGLWYFDVYSLVSLIIFIGILMVLYVNPRQLLISLGLAAVLFVALTLFGIYF